LAHQLRNLQGVSDAHPDLRWPKAMQFLFRYAIHLHHQRTQQCVDQVEEKAAWLERHCDRLGERCLAPPDTGRLQHRYCKYRQNLFVFLYRTDVDPTNNVAEQALRASGVHRKVTGWFRSQWGAKTYAALAPVIDTTELSGIRVFEALQTLIGIPALPIRAGP